MVNGDNQIVPVVTVVHRNPTLDPPGTSLPYTGAPIDALATAGVLLVAIGTALVAVVQRRTAAGFRRTR